MTVYGYARVSVREPEDKNLDLQVERLVRAGCPMGNIRAEEASGAKDGRGGLLELLDLVVEGDTLVVTHIDRLSRGLTYGLQVIEGLHHPTGGPVGVGWNLQPRHGAWPVGSLTQYRRGQRRGKVLPPVGAGPQGSIRWARPASESRLGSGSAANMSADPRDRRKRRSPPLWASSPGGDSQRQLAMMFVCFVSTIRRTRAAQTAPGLAPGSPEETVPPS